MEILVTAAARKGTFSSTLFPERRSCASLIVRGPQSVQDLRRDSCRCGYGEPIVKWLDALYLHDSIIEPERYNEIMEDFANAIWDANTYGIIWERKDECLELTMVFTNLRLYNGGIVYDLPRLQDLTKDHVLSSAWTE